MTNRHFDDFFSKERIQRLEQFYAPPKRQENFLSQEDIQRLIRIACEQPPFKYKLGTAQIPLLWKGKTGHILREKIENALNTDLFAVVGGGYFFTTRPYSVHVDSPKLPSQTPLKQFLFPLATFPDGMSTEVAFFTQRYWGPASYITKEEKQVGDSDCNAVLNDYAKLDGYGQGRISDQEYEQYFFHIERERLEGLCIKEIMPWRPGDMVTFHPCQVHASTNFRKDFLLAKMAVSVVTALP